MGRQFWAEAIGWAEADGTAIANSTAETIIFPDLTIPADTMQDGRVLRVVAFGKHSTILTPTLTFRLRWGGVAGVVLAATEALTTGSGITNLSWRIELLVQTRTSGTSGSLIAMGEIALHTSTTAHLFNAFGSAGVAAPAAVTADTTINKALSLTAAWGTANASNTLTGLIEVVEALN